MIPDAAVWAAANAISRASGMRFDGFWSRIEDLEPEDREYAMSEARAALEAAAPHTLAQVPTDDMVERAAVAQYEYDVISWDDGSVPDWECAGSQQEVYRKGARVALEAALGPAK